MTKRQLGSAAYLMPGKTVNGISANRLNCYDGNGIMQQILLDLEPRRRLYHCFRTELAHSRALLDEQFGEIWVSGEISGVRLASSGHYYFTLKDGESQVKCACFRMAARYLRFKPADGVAVIARGRLDVYDARGEYQLLVEHLEPQGYGALQFAFEQLKKKLTAEGLFRLGAGNGRCRSILSGSASSPPRQAR